ncbi:MAG: hypothetical protein ABI601_14640 [bacterium]
MGDDQFASSFSTTTEADGGARVRVALGTVLGDARVAITVASLGLSDTARYAVRPGAPTRLLLPVRHTALFANARYAIGAAALDPFDNRIPESVAYTSVNALGSVDAAGSVQLTSTVGRGRIVVRAGALVDTAGFVIVPPDLVTLTRGGVVMTVRLDGSIQTVWQPLRAYWRGILSPKGSVLAFWDGDYLQSSIYLTTPAGAPRRLISASQLTMAFAPRFSPDGDWVYFHTNAIWRIRTDGTQLERVAAPSARSVYGFREPSVSPDGRQVIFIDGDASTYVIHDLVSGQERTVPAVGSTPLLSPDGARVGYEIGTALGAMNIDGTGRTYLPCPATSCNGVGWTKDGKWLLTQAFDWIAMVNVTTGEWIHVPGTTGSYNISVAQ